MRAWMQTLLQQLPSPPSAQAQAAARAALLQAQWEGVLVERAAVAARLRRDPVAGQAALAALAECLLAEHRAQCPPQGRWAQVLAQVPPLQSPDPARQRRALGAAGRLDRLSGATERLWLRLGPAIAQAAAKGRGAPLRVLDLNGGHGDAVVSLLRWSRAQVPALAVEVTVADDRAGVIEHLSARLQAEHVTPRVARVDLAAPRLERHAHDLIVMSHVLERLSPGAAAVLLWAATQAARRGVVWLEGWHAPERHLLASLLAARPGAVQVALRQARISPEEMRLLTVGCPGTTQIEAVPPGLLGALWLR